MNGAKLRLPLRVGKIAEELDVLLDYLAGLASQHGQRGPQTDQ